MVEYTGILYNINEKCVNFFTLRHTAYMYNFVCSTNNGNYSIV